MVSDEHVAQVVSYYGLNFMEKIGRLQMRRFADGGVIATLPLPC